MIPVGFFQQGPGEFPVSELNENYTRRTIEGVFVSFLLYADIIVSDVQTEREVADRLGQRESDGRTLVRIHEREMPQGKDARVFFGHRLCVGRHTVLRHGHYD
jgi:hypothetical protein